LGALFTKIKFTVHFQNQYEKTAFLIPQTPYLI
jgi:hypothetical protein